MRQQLLLRTKRGVTPTEAGKVLYRHAQLILRQCEQAGVRTILLKPIGPHELYEAIQRHAGIVIGPGTEPVTRPGPRQVGTSLSATGPVAGTPPAPVRQPWGIPTSKAS